LFLADILGFFYGTRLFLLLRLERRLVLVAVLYLSFVLKRIRCERLFLYGGAAFVYGLGCRLGGSFGLGVALSVGFNLDIDIDIDICRYTDLIGGLGLL
jgi:hypothetical protein